jgi:hypothetical protein
MRHHIGKKDHMAAPIMMTWRKRAKGDKAHCVAMSSVSLAVTEEFSHHRLDVFMLATPKPFKSGGKHVAIGGCGVEFGAPFLDLTDDHVGYIWRNAEQ